MSWLDKLSNKLSGKKGHTEASEQNREGSGTVLRAGFKTPAIAPAGARFKPGDEIAGNLQIKNLLGRGGMGEVWLAKQTQWNTDVALKIPSEELLADAENRHRITREAEAWTELGLHPYITYCYYAQSLDQLLLLVIEYIDGGNLRDWISDRRCADIKACLSLAIQLCHGLERAHSRGLIHRDIKPENILLSKEGIPKITDFGIVRKSRTGAESADSFANISKIAAPGMTMVAIGTNDYMAPEQWDLQKELDQRIDIFAFGVCLYEMFCGRRPYMTTAGLKQDAPDPAKLRGNIKFPKRLSKLLQFCVQWDRENRPNDIKEIRKEICEIYEKAFGEISLYAELPEILTLSDDWNNRALSYLAIGKMDDAKKAWEVALKADPHHVESIYNRGLHRWRKAEITDQQLLSAIQSAAENDSESWLRSYLLAQVHLERGDGDGARNELEKIPVNEIGRTEVVALKQKLDQFPLQSRCIRTFEGHAGAVDSVCLSADGRFALSGSRDKTMKLWEAASGRCIRTFEGHDNWVTSVCLGADGKYALSGSDDKTMKLWEVDSGRCIRTFKYYIDPIRSVCLSADGRHALSGSDDRTLKLWEVASGRCIRTLEGHTSPVRSVYLSADRRYVLSGSWDNTLKLWEAASGRCIRTLEGHTGPVRSVCLSSDGKYALSGSFDNTLKLWKAASGRCIRTLEGHTNSVHSVCLSADGKYALSGGDDRTVRLWDVSNGRCLHTFESHSYLVRSAYMSADGRYALSGSDDKTLKLWTIRPFQYVGDLRLSYQVKVAETFEASGRHMFALSSARQANASGNAVEAYRNLRIARRESNFRRGEAVISEWAKLYVRLRRRILADCWSCWKEKHSNNVTSVCLSADGRYALSGSNDQTLKLWEIASGQCIRTFEDHADSVQSVCLSVDGRYALSGSDDRTLKLWEVASGRCIRTFEGHTGNVTSVCLSVDGRYALSGSGDRFSVMKLWEVASNRCMRTFGNHHSGVASVCFSADGRYALSGSGDKTLELWEVADRYLYKCKFEGHTDSVQSVCLNADGRYALSGSYDKTLKLWEVAGGRCIRTFEGHTDSVYSVCLSADGKYALSGSHDNTLRLWEASSGREVYSINLDASISSVHLSSNGQHVLVGCRNGTLTLFFLDWELEDNQPTNWDEGARPYLDVFLRSHQPYAGVLPQNRKPTDDEVMQALTRKGQPVWSEDDFNNFLYALGCAGYGWLRPEGVRRELERMTAEWPA